MFVLPSCISTLVWPLLSTLLSISPLFTSVLGRGAFPPIWSPCAPWNCVAVALPPRESKRKVTTIVVTATNARWSESTERRRSRMPPCMLDVRVRCQ
ncbi:hypothetical protein JOM56_005073 [Amanita muscaria]